MDWLWLWLCPRMFPFWTPKLMNGTVPVWGSVILAAEWKENMVYDG